MHHLFIKTFDSVKSRLVVSVSSSYLLRLFAVLLALVAVLLIVDRASKRYITATSLLSEAVEIDSPRTLFAKLSALREFEGIKVAVIGDSLIYGNALAQHGVKNWRDQNLTSALARQLQKRYGDQPVMVMNLGMNGALPVDLKNILDLLLPANPDLIIFDVTLRSFSTEFSEPEKQITRPWLKSVKILENGNLRLGNENQSFTDRIDSFLSNTWFLYRVRDFMQWRLLDARPSEFILKTRDTFDAWFKNKPDVTKEDELLLLMKAKGRYANVDFSVGNMQWLAFESMLSQLKTIKKNTVIFYATENPDVLSQLMSSDKHADMISKIASAVRKHQAPEMIFLPPLDTLNAEMFLDHVHLTSNGYEVLVLKLMEQLLPLKLKSSGHSSGV